VLVVDYRRLIHVDEIGPCNVDFRFIRRGDGRVTDQLRRTTPPANARRFGWGLFRRRWRGGRGRCRATSASCRRSRLLFGADAFLALPARTDPRDLVVREQSEMAAHGEVHLTKERDHLVAGNPKFAGQVVYAKLAQTVLLAGSMRVRSMPLSGGRLDERTNASRELWIDDSNRSRRFPSYRGAEL
jgi:hypothetical protein